MPEFEYEDHGFGADDGTSGTGNHEDGHKVNFGQRSLESLTERDYGNPDRVIQTVEELSSEGLG